MFVYGGDVLGRGMYVCVVECGGGGVFAVCCCVWRGVVCFRLEEKVHV